MTKNRHNSNSHRESNHPQASTKNGPTAEILKAQVDVIVPVYRDFKATLRCLQSLLAHPQKTLFEIVVINDASPDREIVKLLERLKSENKITQIDNPVNIGFVDSANLGMMLHLDRDVVILNSDTEVSGDWLDRLRRAAQRLRDAEAVELDLAGHAVGAVQR
jgi:GT2 family glycosyltransferase